MNSEENLENFKSFINGSVGVIKYLRLSGFNIINHNKIDSLSPVNNKEYYDKNRSDKKMHQLNHDSEFADVSILKDFEIAINNNDYF
jgi:hypothetical protein